MRKFVWIVCTIVCSFWGASTWAQRPFICEDQFFQTLTDSAFSALNEVVIDPVTNRVVFKSINNKLPFEVNAAGYRSTDNFIYCVNPKTYDLVRLDANGNATVLKNLPLNRSLLYFAGDVSPDGKYLVLIGRRSLPMGVNVSADIAKVDLEDPNYTMTLSSLNTNTLILDVAFHPVTEVLYGYDSNQQRLVRIDINNSTISTPFPSIPSPYLVGALFFDAFANLFAYGSPDSNTDQNSLYQINPETGRATILTTGTPASSSDGCSCPYTIRLTKTVSPLSAPTCSNIEYTFTLVNSSRRTQTGLRLQDRLPKGFSFVSVKSNPLGGVVSSQPGDNIFAVSDLNLPSGKHEITIVVQTGSVPAGIYRNQARLFGLPESLGDNRVSDNPRTLTEDDSTEVTITRLSFDTLRPQQTLCNEGPLVLDGSSFAAQAGSNAGFLWPDGSRAATFTVRTPGNYPLKLVAGCDTALVVFNVTTSFIELSLVRDTFTIPLGDSIFIETNVQSGGLQTFYRWVDPQPGSLRCVRCTETYALPVNDALYPVYVRNERGCTDSATATVRVRKNLSVYFPNVFAPASTSGANAYFYPSGPVSTLVRSLSVFSRWGDKMFETSDLILNEPRLGWDGISRGKEAPPGVYVWVAEVHFLDGTSAVLKGDVTLVR
jgi:uncharacterized repeat protein (TIGR01451 family)